MNTSGRPDRAGSSPTAPPPGERAGPEVPLLCAEGLTLHYRTAAGNIPAVSGADLSVGRGEALVLLGESGCGKTSLTRALLRITPPNTAKLSGRVFFEGNDIMAFSEERFRREVRWVRISMVMQAAMNAFNPVVRVGEQVVDPLLLRHWTKKEARERAAGVFRLVGIPEGFLARYPFEFSGGMRQRAALAMALAADPALVILDEPTSALDVLTQAGIMNSLKRIKEEKSTGFIMITHDIAAASELADRVALMYAGEIVETASAEQFFRAPSHPYGRLLLAGVPRLRGDRRPAGIPGRPPDMLRLPPGCRFAGRCPERIAACDNRPGLATEPGGQRVRCWRRGPEKL